jgi:hypothetical protein
MAVAERSGATPTPENMFTCIYIRIYVHEHRSFCQLKVKTHVEKDVFSMSMLFLEFCIAIFEITQVIRPETRGNPRSLI